MRISYGITVCNEADELDCLLNKLIPIIDEEDEVLILVDKSNTTQEVLDIINSNTSLQIKVLYDNLNNNFATFKNNLIDHATGDYLFQIDADEYPNDILIVNLKLILTENPDVDAFYIPRVNRVSGITQEYINKWKWSMDNFERINWPDYQFRIMKLNGNIKWKNKVHEIFDGYKSISHLPCNTEDFCLYHYKHITKQIAQNNHYSSINSIKS